MSLQNDSTKHRVFVQRLAGTEAKSIGTYLDKLTTVAKIEAAAGTSGNTLKSSLRDAIKGLTETALENLADIAEYESKFVSRLYNKYIKDAVFNPVEKETLSKKLKSENMAVNNVHVHNGKTAVDTKAQKKSVITAYRQFGNRKADELAQIIEDGRTTSIPTSEVFTLIDQRVQGLHTVQAAVLAATAVNFATNIAKSQTLSENYGIIKYVAWISTLDAGTCDYCESLHESVFEEGDSPDIPAHWGCRCELIPYVE